MVRVQICLTEEDLLRGARGMWRERADLSVFEAIRREFDERGTASVER